jgi:hypothetical protein
MENGAEMRFSAPFGVSGGRELIEDLLARADCNHGANTGLASDSLWALLMHTCKRCDATRCILARVVAECTRE